MKIENLQNGKIALVENANTLAEMRFGNFDARERLAIPQNAVVMSYESAKSANIAR
jgi:hypothetical protein